jgi:small subunit ribosomal protein S6
LAAPREYELVLMLDPQLDAPARDGLAQNARAEIEASGSLKHENSWGLRKMAYEINKRTEADYRWFRFEAPSDLLDSLDHNLKIADGVLRFRVFKTDPSAPVIVPPAVTAAPGPRERGGGGGREDRDESHGGSHDSREEVAPEAPAEAASEVAPEAPAEAPSDDAPEVSADAPADVAPEVPAETPSDVAPDAGADVAPDASADVSSDVTADASADE